MNDLLPQAYPEGCPCHPSYPAGHGVYMGAVTTVLKAWYQEDFLMDSFEPSADGTELLPTGQKLRVGDELDKMGLGFIFDLMFEGSNWERRWL